MRLKPHEEFGLVFGRKNSAAAGGLSMERRALRHAFYKTHIFKKRADELDAWEDVDDLKEILDANPDAGDVIPGGSGMRKIRMPLRTQAKGRRGGARVIYFQVTQEGFIFLLYIYAKNDVADLSQEDLDKLIAVRDADLAVFREERKNATKRTEGTRRGIARHPKRPT
jgi:hypothetical protein